MKKKGSVTVFFSLLLAVILFLMQALLGSLRLAGGRIQAETGVEEGLYSIFSRYDRELFEKYHVFFLNGAYGARELHPERMYQEIENTLKDTGIRGENLWKCANQGGAILGYTLATDQMGQLFQKQAVAHMKDTIGIQGIHFLLQEEKFKEQIIKKQEKNGEKISVQKTEQAYDEAKKQGEKEEITENETTVKVPEDFVNPIEIVNDLRKRGVLSLVLPMEKEISKEGFGEKIPLSKREKQTGIGVLHCGKPANGIVDQELFRAYMMQHLECFTNSNSSKERMQYQLEYVVGGKMTDEENLKSVVKRLLVMREGANLAYLLADATKQQQIHQFSLLICASLGVPAIESVVTFLLQAAWAFGESVLDVRQLLAGGKVPLIKTGKSWKLPLENLAKLPQILEQVEKEKGEGLEYKEYLRCLLSMGKGQKQVLRTMDMIEESMREIEGKEAFQFDQYIGYLEVRWKVSCCGQLYSIQRAYGYDM